uniref:Uncharacterized protein n=1 Tax=Canis lupus dingo TaxID=286419 RepID=A0A8C0JR82_CANLU
MLIVALFFLIFFIYLFMTEPKCPSTDEWIKKMCIYIYNGILLSHRENEFLSFEITWTELKYIMLSEINQPEKDKYHMISFYCGI